MNSGAQGIRVQHLWSIALLLVAIAALFATRLSHDATTLFLAHVAGGVAFTVALTLFASMAGRTRQGLRRRDANAAPSPAGAEPGRRSC